MTLRLCAVTRLFCSVLWSPSIMVTMPSCMLVSAVTVSWSPLNIWSEGGL